MSSNYSLDLSNPRIHGTQENVVHTGLDGGNTLNLVIGNHSGSDVVIGGRSAGKHLRVQISKNIIDEQRASKLGVIPPWTIASHETSSTTKQFFTFNLTPPAAGVSLPTDGTVTITLQNLDPTEAGTAQVLVSYRFDDIPSDDLNAAASLSSLAAPDANSPPLVGDDHALRATIYVNNGPASNPIMVSGGNAPLTSADAVENTVRVNLLFQRAQSFTDTKDVSSGLVTEWDPNRPPAFRIFFPYFNPFQGLPAPLDLTDSFTQDDDGYNALTSAWNIHGTLDPDNSSVTDDGFWRIGIDGMAPVPVWTVTPTTCNIHLFTAVESAPSESGPALDIYFPAVVSVLPIDPRNPETILFLQWTGFPGFNDGLIAVPLQKTPLTIQSFSAALVRTSSGPSLRFEWKTSGDHCRLSPGTTDVDQCIMPVTSECIMPVTADQPLHSSYTLTAVGKDGVTRVMRSLSVRWKLNSKQSSNLSAGKNIRASSDGKALIVSGRDELGLQFFDPKTLDPLPQKPFSLPGILASGFAIAPDSKVVYIAGAKGAVYGYNAQTERTTPGSGRLVEANAEAHYLALSPDASNIAVVASFNVSEKNRNPSSSLHVLHNYNMEETAGSPVAIPDMTVGLAVGPQSGRYYLALQGEIIILNPVTYEKISPQGLALSGVAQMAISADESSLFALSWDIAANSSFILTLIDATTLAIKRQRFLGLGYAPLAALAGSPLSALVTSADSTMLFLVGVDPKALVENRLESRLSVFDAETLQELSWSPLKVGDFVPIDVTLSPDGSRLFLLAGENIYLAENIDSARNQTRVLYAADPEFR